jgi:hypothetical protein
VDEDPPAVLAKPDALLALHSTTEELFGLLKAWFAVPDVVPLNLTEIDAVVSEMSDPVMIAALAMRKLQALRLLSTPGVRTSTDVVLAIVNDLERALVHAPVIRLKLQASVVDWDEAFSQLELGSHPSRAGHLPQDVAEADPEAEHFRALHAKVHEAAFAVYEASNGEICLFE